MWDGKGDDDRNNQMFLWPSEEEAKQDLELQVSNGRKDLAVYAINLSVVGVVK